MTPSGRVGRCNSLCFLPPTRPAGGARAYKACPYATASKKARRRLRGTETNSTSLCFLRGAAMVKKWLALHGGNNNLHSPYATTSAVSFKGTEIQQRPPPSPWLGDHMSRHGFQSSGYQHAFYRDLPPGGAELEDTSAARNAFSKHPPWQEEQEWKGSKDKTPLNSCLRRGEIKEPRFYPFKIGSVHGAHALIQPSEKDPEARFERPAVVGKGPIDANAHIMKMKHYSTAKSGFSTGNSEMVGELITERQGQEETRIPAMTMLRAERVASDSTARYFHARDYYENPFMSSSSYYQQDTLAQHGEMKRKKESLTAVPSTRPLSQYALFHNDAPYAPDVGDGVGPPVKRIGEGIEDAWGGPVPHESERVGLLPTAFSRTTPVTTGPTVDPGYPKPAPPLPERFARIRARHDYLRWGAVLEGPADRYLSTSRVELSKPSQQEPLGGWPKPHRLGSRVVPTDHTGYHMQISADPIVEGQK